MPETKEQLRARLNEAWKGYESRCSHEGDFDIWMPDVTEIVEGKDYEYETPCIEFCFRDEAEMEHFQKRFATELSELYRRDELPESHSKNQHEPRTKSARSTIQPSTM